MGMTQDKIVKAVQDMFAKNWEYLELGSSQTDLVETKVISTIKNALVNTPGEVTVSEDDKDKEGYVIVVSETYSVFVEGAQNFEQAKEEWDELALDSERCKVIKYYEDDVTDSKA
jgi:hypothetical protein